MPDEKNILLHRNRDNACSLRLPMAWLLKLKEHRTRDNDCPLRGVPCLHRRDCQLDGASYRQASVFGQNVQPVRK
jgi:hypothetical protein